LNRQTISDTIANRAIVDEVLSKAQQGDTPSSDLPTLDEMFTHHPEMDLWAAQWIAPAFSRHLLAALLSLGNPKHQRLETDDNLTDALRDFLSLSYSNEHDSKVSVWAGFVSDLKNDKGEPLSGCYRAGDRWSKTTGKGYFFQQVKLGAHLQPQDWLARVRVFFHEVKHAAQWYDGQMSDARLGYISPYCPPRADDTLNPLPVDYTPSELDSRLFQEDLRWLLVIVSADDSERFHLLTRLRDLHDEFQSYRNDVPNNDLLSEVEGIRARIEAAARKPNVTLPASERLVRVSAAIALMLVAREADYRFQHTEPGVEEASKLLNRLLAIPAASIPGDFLRGRHAEEQAYAYDRLGQLAVQSGNDPQDEHVLFFLRALEAAFRNPNPRMAKYISSAVAQIATYLHLERLRQIADDIHSHLYASAYLSASGEAARARIIRAKLSFKGKTEEDSAALAEECALLHSIVIEVVKNVITPSRNARDVEVACAQYHTRKDKTVIHGFAKDIFAAGAVGLFVSAARRGSIAFPAADDAAFAAFENGCYVMISEYMNLACDGNDGLIRGGQRMSPADLGYLAWVRDQVAAEVGQLAAGHPTEPAKQGLWARFWPW
jgi:hypothetical protein